MQPMAYTETAYNTRRPRYLPPATPDEERSFTMRAWRRDKLGTRSVECGEYLTIAGVDEVRDLQDDKSQNKLTNNLAPLTLAWGGTANPLFWAAYARFACSFISFMIIFGTLVMAVMTFFNSDQHFAETMSGTEPFLIVAAVLLLLRFLLNYLIKHDKVPNRNNTVFERCTGMVHLPAGKGEVRSIPFDEFAPYVHTFISNYGTTYNHLMVGHKYSDAFAVYSGSHDSIWLCDLEWEFYLQFMDVSKPLPDVPSLEPWRAIDPTTIEWDKRMNRPADFWKNSPKGEYGKLSREAWDAAERFHWGSNRQMNIEMGWQPSPFGKRTWWDAKPQKITPHQTKKVTTNGIFHPWK